VETVAARNAIASATWNSWFAKSFAKSFDLRIRGVIVGIAKKVASSNKNLRSEIQGLRDEVQGLREEIRQIKRGAAGLNASVKPRIRAHVSR
jgi:hypothetical protein